jgi:hypothetical protein
MRRRRRTLVPRDQAVSTFSATLLRLCDATGAVGAALVDQQGETVDYAGYLEPFALKVMAAEWRIVLDSLRGIKKQGFVDAREFVVRARQKSFALVALAEGYALVLELPRGTFSFSRRAVAESVRELELEAGLPASNPMLESERWAKLEVRTAPGNRRRPEAIWFQGAWHPVTIVGRYATQERTHAAVTPAGPRSEPGGGGTASVGRAASATAPPGSEGLSARGGGAGAPPTSKGAPPPTYKTKNKPSHAIAYRARLGTGHEFALVREPLGLWFADDLTGFEPVPR